MNCAPKRYMNQEEISSRYNNKNVKIKRERTAEYEPPDGGWGWVVLAGASLITLTVPLPTSVFGIIYSDLLLENSVSSTTIGWIFNLEQCMVGFSSLLAGPLSERYGWRNVAFFGALLSGSSTALSGFATSPGHLFVLFCIFFGLGTGTAIAMCHFIVPHYFKKKRGMVIGLMMSSISCGQLIAPLIVNQLVELYGYRGIIFILGAIAFNGCAAALLFHPISWHAKNKICNSEISKFQECSDSSNNYKEIQELEMNSLINTKDIPRDKDATTGSVNDLEVKSDYCKYDQPLQNIENGSIAANHDFYEQQVITETNRPKGINEKLNNTFLKNICTNLKMIRSYRVCIISFGCSLLICSSVNCMMMIPFIMTEHGHSLKMAGWGVLISEATSTATRVIISILIDVFPLSSRYYIMTGALLLSSSIFALTMVTSLQGFFIVLGFYGVATGWVIVLSTIIIIEFMGIEYLPRTFGIFRIVLSLTLVILGPIIGLIRDLSGSFTLSLRTISCLILVSFILWTFMPLAQKSDKKRNCAQILHEDIR